MNSVWYYPHGQPEPWLARLQALEEQCRAYAARVDALERQLSDAKQREDQLQAAIAGVQSRLDEVQRQPPVHVEYHFDQLKVSRLDGTLNIGISPGPGSGAGVESFEVPAPGMWQTPSVGSEGAEAHIPGLLQQGAAFMDQEAPADLSAVAEQNGLAFQPSELRRVTEDVKAQMSARLQYYARTTPLPEQPGDGGLAQWKQDVLNKFKRDARAAFENYVRRRAGGAPAQGGG